VNRVNKIWRLIPIILIGLILNYRLIKCADNEFIFDAEILFIIGFVFFLFYAFDIYLDIKEYSKNRSVLSFLPTITGFFIVLSFFVTNHILMSRDKSPILIQAGSDGGFNGAWFEFREDGTYKFVNSGGIGASYFRGTYSVNDSIITLDKANINNVIKNNKLAIRIVKSFGAKRLLYQINDKHIILPKEIIFTINEDNRKVKKGSW
jgi:hypothetical protein